MQHAHNFDIDLQFVVCYNCVAVIKIYFFRAVIAMYETVCETEKLLDTITDLGRQMLMCGAEINRVEDTLTRLCTAYKLECVDVFSITSLIIVSVKDHDGTSHSKSKRISSYIINLYRLEELNALSREACSKLPPADELSRDLNHIILNSHFNKPLRLLGFILTSAGFTVFFGGTPMDALFSALISVIIFLIERFFTVLSINSTLYNFASSFAAGALAVLSLRVGFSVNVDKIMIGDIMLLIPGLMLTNAIRDMVSGDTMAGFLRMCEAILTAVAIALGYVCSMIVTGVIS